MLKIHRLTELADQFSFSRDAARLLHSETCRWITELTNVSFGHRALIGPFKFGAAKEPLKFWWRVVPGGHRVHRT